MKSKNSHSIFLPNFSGQWLLAPATTHPPTTYFPLPSCSFYLYRFLLGCKLSVLTSGTEKTMKAKSANNISFDEDAELVMTACIAYLTFGIGMVHACGHKNLIYICSLSLCTSSLTFDSLETYSSPIQFSWIVFYGFRYIINTLKSLAALCQKHLMMKNP